MKTETLQTLITAKTLLDKSRDLCLAEDKYLASAGLVILQDGLELVLYACLLELGTDEEKPLEKMSFDELIAEMKRQGKLVKKSGTLRALNRERVNIKHFGQLAEPTTVRGYYEAAMHSTEALLRDVVLMSLQEIMLHELLRPGEAKEHISKACTKLEEREFYESLVEIRKAIYTEIETHCSIEDWKDYIPGSEDGILYWFSRGGHQAPWHTKNAKWISENVNNPFDYIQIDHERMRSDLMEWGVSTEDFWNVRRLTPKVFRFSRSKTWATLTEPAYAEKAANEKNTRYCLDRAVSILLSKQLHSDRFRSIENQHALDFSIRLTSNQPIYRKASITSETTGSVEADKVYRASSLMQGLDGNAAFVRIRHYDSDASIVGYVLADHCEIVRPSPTSSE